MSREDAGTVNNFVCIDITGGSGCPVSYSFVVELSSSGTGKQLVYSCSIILFYDNTAVEVDDYVSIDRSVTVPRCQTQLCMPVTNIDDRIVENEENLIITISTDAQRVLVDRNADIAELIIDDNDSE